MSFAFLPLFTGDYLRDTRTLSPLKHGVYLLLLIYCWDTKGPVPLEEQEAAAITNCRSADEIDALRYVLSKYFTRMEDGFYNERMQDEIANSEFVSKKRSEAGKLGAEARKKHKSIKELKQVLSNRKASAKQLPVTPTLTLTPTLTPKKEKDPPGFESFWSAYPHFPNRSSKAESRKRWGAMGLEPIAAQVMVALRACLDVPQWTKSDREFVCASEVWLKKRLWEQELISDVRGRLIESILSDPRFADMKP